MRIAVQSLLIVGICFISSKAGVVKRPPDKQEEFAMDFFDDFNNLFGFDWWGNAPEGSVGTTDEAGDTVIAAAASHPTPLDHLEWEGQPQHHQKSELDALIEDVLNLTEPPPTRDVRTDGSSASHLIHQTHFRNKPQVSAHSGEIPRPLQNHIPPHQQPHYQGQVPYNPYQYQYQAQNPHAVPTHAQYYPSYPQPAAHPYYYPPAYMQHAPHSVPESNAEVEPNMGERSLETDEPSQENGNEIPPAPAVHPMPQFFLPPPPQQPYGQPHPYQLAQHHPRMFYGEPSLDDFMSQAPTGPQIQVRNREASPPGLTYQAEPPRMVFLDPSMDTFMSAAETKAQKIGESAPSRRMSGEEDRITLQTMLDEKEAANAKLMKDDATRDNLIEDEKASIAPERRMTGESHRLEVSNLDYSSLTKSNTAPHPPIEELMDDEDHPNNYDDNVSELDETVICQTSTGLIGSCDTPTECSLVSGLPSGPCTVPSVSGGLTCCLHSARCGQQSAQLVTYIHNDEYPATTTSIASCPISIALLPDICQVRLDFLHLSLAPPVEGSCDPDNSITLSTTPGGQVAQHPLCDYIAGTDDPLSSNIPHLYAHYNLTHSPLPYHYHQLNLNIAVSDFPSTWNIRVAQIRCDLRSPSLTPLMASSSCSQWYTSTSAIMDSVILLSGSKKQFKACIKPDPAACAVKYHFYSVVCNKQDKVQILGSDMAVCGVSTEEWEVVLPAGDDMGVVVSPGMEQDGGASSYTVGYSLLYDCAGLTVEE